MKKYILEAENCKWGPKTAKLDPEKIKLLDSYIVGNKILDIGAATGIFSNYLERKGYSVVALDRKQDLLRFSKNKNKIIGDLRSLPFRCKMFDTSVLFDVLEHVEEEYIKEVIKITSKRIIITVPRETDKVLKKNWLIFAHHLDKTHLRTYTREAMLRFLNKYHLKKILIKGAHAIPAGELFMDIIEGSPKKREIIRTLAFKITKTKKFFSNFAVVADVES